MKTLKGSDRLRDAYPKMNDNFTKLDEDLGEITTQLAQTASDASDALESANTAKEKVDKVQKQEHPAYRTPLKIVPPDGNPNVCHPSVLRIDGGWNGYVYWMAYTPFPDTTRENPHIVASHNGVDWEEPEGINNPVVPLEHIQSLGYSYNSDVDLIIVNGKLELYYRCVGAGIETVFRRTSENGVIWGDEQEIITKNRNTLLSPTVVHENGIYQMWVIDREDSNNRKMKRYTSTDGISYNNPENCQVKGLGDTTPFFWHPQVRKFNGRYHLLSSEYSSWRLIYAYSDDGIIWQVDNNRGELRQSGMEFDSSGFYRATFVPSFGDGMLFDIWANVVKADANGSVNSGSSEHRISYYKNIDLIGGSEKVAVKDVRRIWLDPSRFVAGLGNPSLQVQHQTVPFWRLTSGNYIRMRTSSVLPKHFKAVYFRIYWANLSENEGNVVLSSRGEFREYGQIVTQGSSFYSSQFVFPAQDQFKIQVAEMTVATRDYETNDDQFAVFGFDRRGNHVDDTLNGDIAVYGFEILGYIPPIKRNTPI